MADNRIEAWLRVRDAGRFQGDMNKSAASVSRLERAARGAGAGAGFLGRTAGGARGALFGFGSAASYAAIGLGVAGAGAVKMGIDFNSTMEQNRVAIGMFLGSGEKAQAMLDQLFETAKNTPFSFQDVTQAARKFLAFGFTAKETTRNLNTVGDAIAGIGGGNDEIQRMIIALGQMKAKGKVMGQELLQLTELGIPAYQILQEQLGLTSKQMKRVGDEGISADKGIDAIMRGIQKRFGGAAAAQSNTLKGQWEKLKDTFAQTMGEITEPLFKYLKSAVLPALNRILPVIQKEAPKVMSAFWAGLKGQPDPNIKATVGIKPDKSAEGGLGPKEPSLAAKAGALVAKGWDLARKGFAIAKDTWNELFTAIKPAMPFIENVVLPLAKGIAIGIGVTLVGAFKLALLILRPFAKFLGWLGKKAEPLKPLFTGIGVVIGSLLGGPILKGLSFIPKLGGVFLFLGRALGWMSKGVGIAIGFIGRLIGWGIRLAMPFMRFAGWIAGAWLRIHIMAWGTVWRVITGAIGRMTSIPGRIWGIFRRAGGGIGNAFKATFGLARQAIGWYIDKVLGLFVSLPMKFLRLGWRLGKSIFDGIKNAFGSAAGFASDIGRKLGDWLNDHTILGDTISLGPIGKIKIPKFAAGGRMPYDGLALVGEKGPEVVHMNRGNYVANNRQSRRTYGDDLVASKGLSGRRRGTPAGSAPADALVAPDAPLPEAGSGSRGRAQGKGGAGSVIQLVVGRRVLAEVVAEEIAEQKARR